MLLVRRPGSALRFTTLRASPSRRPRYPRRGRRDSPRLRSVQRARPIHGHQPGGPDCRDRLHARDHREGPLREHRDRIHRLADARLLGTVKQPERHVPTANGTAFRLGSSVTFSSGVSSTAPSSFSTFRPRASRRRRVRSRVIRAPSRLPSSRCDLHGFQPRRTDDRDLVLGLHHGIRRLREPATTYTGSQSLVFSGPSNSPNATVPTAKNSSNTAINFGSATATTFASGAATVTVTLYDAQTTQLTATQGSVTGATTRSRESATAATLVACGEHDHSGGRTGDNLTITAFDTYGNTATGYTGSENLTFGGAHSQGSNNPTVSNSSGTAIPFGTSTAITFKAGCRRYPGQPTA